MRRLVIVGAAMMLTNPTIRRYASQIRLTSLLSAAIPGIERMMRLLDALAGAGLLGADRSDDLRAIPRDGLAAAVRRATRVAAITCTRPGADPPTREELVAAYPDEGRAES